MAHLLLSQDYLNKKSPIPMNIEWIKVEPFIEIAQINDLMPLLGSDYYDELITQTTSPNTPTAANLIILNNYVLPCLTQYFLARATPFFRATYANKGVMVKSSDNSQNADLSETKYLIDIHKNTAEEIADRMMKYLRLQGASVYPTYFSANNQTLIPPANDAFDSPIYLEDNLNVNPYPNWGDFRYERYKR